ncbi:hypothetical protein Msub_12501 [Marinobacter subterrani]|uniref:Uncharacterized protein n=1 Tax=Marinobacter subterrani TaxID=1658765 RepID=A0A0J7JET3_9GAMM|nr:hypothetical protein Msub_12501 [Marinobacter subterrani]
MLRVCCATGRY